MKLIKVKSIEKVHYSGKIHDLEIKNSHTYNIDNIIVGNCSSGLHGVGVKAVNALSDKFEVTVKRDGHIYQQTFSKGSPVSGVKVLGDSEETGTKIFYHPDDSIFKLTLEPSERLVSRLSELASLNSGIVIHYENEITNIIKDFHYEDGIVGYTRRMIEDNKRLYDEPFSIKGDYELENGGLIICEISFIHDDELEPNCKIKTFANNVNTYEGGFHLKGFKNAYKNILNKYGVDNKIISEAIDLKYLLDGLYAVISIKIPEAEFEGQTKTKLGNSIAKDAVENIMEKYFESMKDDENVCQCLEAIVTRSAKVKEAEEAAKKARAINRKLKKNAKSALPGKLADCSNKTGYKELFLVEGDSAAGCGHGNTLIKLVDGRIIKLKDLVEEFNKGIKNYVYSCKKNGEITVQPIIDAFKTKHVNKLCKIVLDNGEEIKFTPNHLFMLKDGSYKEAQHLTNIDSLMPLYMKTTEYEHYFDNCGKNNENKSNIIYYKPFVMHNNTEKYEPVYILSSRQYHGEKVYGKENHTHHIDFNAENNNPENLEYINNSEHAGKHAKKFWTKENRIKQGELTKQMWKNDDYRKVHQEFAKEHNYLLTAHREKMKNDPEYFEQNWKKLHSPEKALKRQESLKKFFNEHQEAKDHLSDVAKEQWKDKELLEWRAKKTSEQMKQPGYMEAHKQKIYDKKKEHAMDIIKQLVNNGIEINKVNYDNARTKKEQPKWKTLLKYFESDEKILKWVSTYNHRIVSVEIIEEEADVYDLTVPPYNNFALAAGIFVHNSAKTGRFNAFQAILAMRGKILNVSKADIAKILKSEVIKNIVNSLGGGIGKDFCLDDIRYDKIILMCFTGDTKVKLLNGSIKTFEELVEMEKQNPGQVYWVYSKDKYGNIVPGEGNNPRIVGYRKEILELTLDNDFKITCTPDHKFILKDGTKKEAKDLTINDSLSSIYMKINNDETILDNGYEMVYDDIEGKWKFTHHIVNNYPEYGNHTHHIDLNKYNNSPDNLLEIDKVEHSRIHMIDKNKNNKKLIENRAAANKIHFTKYNKSESKKIRLKELHVKGVYKHTYFGENGYNGSEEQKIMLKKLNKREDMQKMHSEIFSAYNKSEQNKESTIKLNKREDVKFAQAKMKIVHNVSCLIRKNINLTEDVFNENKLKNILVNVPSKKSVEKYFDSYEELFILALQYEKNDLNDEMFDRLTDIEYASKQRILSNMSTKKSQMGKIGKLVLDKGLELNEKNYELIKKENKSRATRFENLSNYFDDEQEFVEFSANYNHKIKSKRLITLENEIPVYCMTVEDYHNFAIVTENISKDEYYNSKCKLSTLIVNNCDADVDGSHIRSLALTLFYYYMPGLIESGKVYSAVAPLYRIIKSNSESIYLSDDSELKKYVAKHPKDKYIVKRFKGLGEMDPDQLTESTMSPKTRTLKQITMNDAKEAAESFEILMGKDASLRRTFIEANAFKANLDLL